MRPTFSSSLLAPSRLIFNESPRVATWVQQKLPNFLGWFGAYEAIGYERNGLLCGGVVFSGYSGTNMILAVALDAPLTRAFLRGIFFYPFLQMNCRRITALIDASNTKSRRLVEHAGFRQEGVLRDGAPTEDVILYGMTRDECRFIRRTA